MFNYDAHRSDDSARCYRHDLIPRITAWLDSLPASEWQHFVAFRVGARGQFVAKFVVPDADGYLRVVTAVVD